MGTIPRSMTAVLEYDLVDSCKAGDDVTIYGIVTQIWDTPIADTRCTVETVLHANYIEVTIETSFLKTSLNLQSLADVKLTTNS